MNRIARGLPVLAAIFFLGGCTMLGGGTDPQVPVEERSTAGGRAVAKPQPRAGTDEPDVVLVSPLEQPAGGEWKPLQPTPQDAVQASPPARRSYSQPRSGELNPAVVALLNRANQAERGGKLEQSAASLERALRIQPDNAWLWHRLALVRLFQEQSREAIGTAEKSNSLARGNRRLQAENWRVIAQARERLGQMDAAAAAARKAASMQR